MQRVKGEAVLLPVPQTQPTQPGRRPRYDSPVTMTLSPTRSQDAGIMEFLASPMQSETEPPTGQDYCRRYETPPPLHTGADWKIILLLPEIDTWLRTTSERVRGLTQSVQEDPQSKHVDVHLMQLKEICEDISDHVEQIHALLDTEFSLKLLSYSVNVIVDIHAVQLLWHQLRVSVLVLRERILQGLQDSNGNYTRQTDILQAFTHERQEDRLDALTEVDGSGQLTIRCPPDYFSLDCGITAYELSDYSPREEEPHPPPAKPLQAWTYSAMQQEFPDLVRGPGLLSVAPESEQEPLTAEWKSVLPSPHSEAEGQPALRAPTLTESTTPKRPLQESSDHGGDSPTRPSLPKRGLFLSEGDNWGQASTKGASVGMSSHLSALPTCLSSPRNHLTLTLTPPYSPAAPLSPKTQLQPEAEMAQEEQAGGELCSPMTLCPHGREPSGDTTPYQCKEESEREPRGHGKLDSSPQETGDTRWFGSDEFLALPSHLRQADLLALHLDSLSQLVSPAPEELQLPLRDVEDWEISSGSEAGPVSPRCLSPSTPCDLAPYPVSSGRSTPGLTGSGRQDKAALIQRLMWDIQRQDNDRHVWDRIQGFVTKLDRFIRWLQEAMEATENWTPPQPETEALQLYLQTHLNFKQSVDGHCGLKDAVLQEGERLMELLVSHRPGLLEMLQMITAQWKQLQRQIRRQHGWILRALDTIKAEILKTEGTPEGRPEPQVNGPLRSLDAQRDAVSQMSLQLSNAQNSQIPQHPELTSQEGSLRSDSVQGLEAECQEFWDWLIDIEATVQNSLGLLVSEEQHVQMCKRCSVEMSLREDRIQALLGQLASLKRDGAPLPDRVLDKEGLIREKWEMLKRSLSEALSATTPQPVLSPGSGTLVQQLEERVKELKSWLRDTELALYNSSLGAGEEGEGSREGIKGGLQRELHKFQSLCSELRLRRRGVASVLRLCHHLLSLQEVSQQNDPPTMQLLIVNLERRWEAIVMQSTQWQRRLHRELGEEQELDLLLDPDWMDLSGAGAEEALEWDETDIATETVCGSQESEHIGEESSAAEGRRRASQAASGHSSHQGPFQPLVYQVYSLHNMEIFRTNMDPPLGKGPRMGPLSLLPLSLLQGGAFSSLPDLAGGSPPARHYQLLKKTRGGSSGHSESESGIASGGEGVTAANSEGCLSLDGEGLHRCQAQGDDSGQEGGTEVGPAQYSSVKNHGLLSLYDCSLLQTDKITTGVLERVQRAIPSLCFSRIAGQAGANRTMLRSSSEDHSPDDNIDFQDLIEVLSPQDSPPSSSSLDSLSAACKTLEPMGLRRSVSLESWPASYKSNEDLFSQQCSADITPGSDPGEELSKRTLDLLKRLEDIECPSEQKMKRSLSDDVTLRSGSHEASLTDYHSPPDKGSSENEDLGSELTELSSSEELSLRSEDLAVLKGRLVDSNASFRRHLSRSLGGEEGEANLSMIVNVSCTSACTDEEDDSDLLSSSTLTLTEEEEELDEPNSSMGSEDEAGEGTELPLGADFIRRELQAWIRPSFLIPRERRKVNRAAHDMAGVLSAERLQQSSSYRGWESNGNGKDSCKGSTRAGLEETMYNPSQLVDDVENGNVQNSLDPMKDRATKCTDPEGGIKPGTHQWALVTKTERLHPPSMPALAYHKPREPGVCCNGKSSLRVTCDSTGDVDMPESSWMAPDSIQEGPNPQVPGGAPESSCPCHSSATERPGSPDCTVHEFVKEILGITALHGAPAQDGPGHGTGAQIKEKVLEYSRRQLTRGDFYSYLSLSSHDSDCGELSGYTRRTTPHVPAEEDGEGNIAGIFEASIEEEEQVCAQSADPKGFSIVVSTQPPMETVPAKAITCPTGLKRPQNRAPTPGQRFTPKASALKLQGHSEVITKGAGTKINSKTLPVSRELQPEPRGKSSAKPVASSLPVLHKRVHEQRVVTADSHSMATGHQKKSSHGPKTHRDL